MEYGLMDCRILCNISMSGPKSYPNSADILSNYPNEDYVNPV